MRLRLRLAVTPFARMRGMLGLSALAVQEEEVFFLAPCRRIHTIGMRFAIDAAWIAADGQVLRVVRDLAPGRLSRSCSRAVAVLERCARAGDWLRPGQFVELTGSREERNSS